MPVVLDGATFWGSWGGGSFGEAGTRERTPGFAGDGKVTVVRGLLYGGCGTSDSVVGSSGMPRCSSRGRPSRRYHREENIERWRDTGPCVTWENLRHGSGL